MLMNSRRKVSRRLRNRPAGAVLSLVLLICATAPGCRDEGDQGPKSSPSGPPVQAVSPWKRDYPPKPIDLGRQESAEAFLAELSETIWPTDAEQLKAKQAELAQEIWTRFLSEEAFFANVSDARAFRLAGLMASWSENPNSKRELLDRLAGHYFAAGKGSETLWRLEVREIATLGDLLGKLKADSGLVAAIAIDYAQHNGRWLPQGRIGKWREAYSRDGALGRLIGPDEAMRHLDATVNAEGLVYPGVARAFTWACREVTAWRKHLDRAIAGGTAKGDRLAGWLLARAYVQEVHRRPPIELRGRKWSSRRWGRPKRNGCGWSARSGWPPDT